MFISLITRIWHQLLQLRFGHLTCLQQLRVPHFLIPDFYHKTANEINRFIRNVQIFTINLPIDHLLLLIVHISQRLSFRTFSFQFVTKYRLLRRHTVESFGQLVQIEAQLFVESLVFDVFLKDFKTQIKKFNNPKFEGKKILTIHILVDQTVACLLQCYILLQ